MTRRAPSKAAIGYRLGSSVKTYGHEYADLTLQIIPGRLRNAAREYESSPSDYALDKLQRVRAASDTADYLEDGMSDSRVEIRWQADRNGWDEAAEGCRRWYSPSVEMRLNADGLLLLAKLAKRIGLNWSLSNATPEQVLTALKAMGARRVAHPDNEYVFDNGEDVEITKRPWGDLPPVEAVESGVAVEA